MVYSLVGAGDEENLRKMAEEIYRSKAMTELQTQQQQQPVTPTVAR